MLSQITFRAETSLKRAAMSKARAEGIPLKSFLTHSLRAFVADQIKIGLQHAEVVERAEFASVADRVLVARHARALKKKKMKLHAFHA